ncbi:GntR family transcriptional regulator [Achromobacter sp. GG226]|uniref:GntR family transcriptional regulator n=1 Tax=Verticiella alkaliphila TaxID=2779529 RepID=UPI001C0E21E0|nr:GntR family transcriptional regulator [Verticiella sp. GG226]MBU4609673.1 GntR family transcriptional regulator [Verticiella sp. GG226]
MKVSEQIRQSIEEDIRHGILLPGDTIDEHGIAERFGVSRTPVREAMLQLQAQSLLISVPRNGMVVARMDVPQLLAIWELLTEMEGVCARLACERMTDDEREQLSEIHAKAAEVVANDDVAAWSRVNHDFHEVLYHGARNPYLRQELMRLRARTGAYLRHAFSAVGRLPASHAQHGEVVDAILARDPARAHDTMMRHISLEQGARDLRGFLVNLPKSMLSS